MKKTNENLVILITLFAISIVIANVTGARTITTGLHIGPIELALSGGAITYAVTFLCTDIIGEIWGTVIYAVISFGFGLGWVHTHEGRMQLIGIIIGQYLLKACLALLDTPFFYFFTRNADRR